jgi:hypothetical protein
MIPNDACIRIVPSLEDWPAMFAERSNDGTLKDSPDQLNKNKADAEEYLVKLNELVLKMCEENPCPSRAEHLELYRQFVVLQQEFVIWLDEFDNTQNWYPEDEINSGKMNLTDMKIIKGGFVKNAFMTSKGDLYSVEFSDATKVISTKRKPDPAGERKSKSGRILPNHIESLAPALKRGLQPARRIETGVPRGRIIYYDAWTHELHDEQTLDPAVQSYPDPADVFGPTFSQRNVDVMIQDFKFEHDKMGPKTSSGCFGGTPKLHYRYKFRAEGGKPPEIFYAYRDM